MTIIPALTSTDRSAMHRFIADLAASSIRAIAFFPTALEPGERRRVYRDLEAIQGLHIPHVHIRSDFDEAEMEYCVRRFGTEVFNIHPAASRHPFGEVPRAFAGRVFVENVEVAPTAADLARCAGMCPDYSHLENARFQGRLDYVGAVESACRSQRIGCCHISAVRPGRLNPYNGGIDHHRFESLSDLDYMLRYGDLLPETWVSLELENDLDEQLAARDYLNAMLAPAQPPAADLYDLLARNYEALFPPDEETVERVAAAARGAARVSGNGTGGGSVLDLGCGTGGHVRRLLARGVDAWGIDGNAEMIRQARLLDPAHGERYVVGDLRDAAGHRAAPFACVACLGNTISHLGGPGDIRDFLAGLCAGGGLGGLAPGGRVVLQFVDASDLPPGSARDLPELRDPASGLVMRRRHRRIDESRLAFDVELAADGHRERTEVALTVVETARLVETLASVGYRDIDVSTSGRLRLVEASC